MRQTCIPKRVIESKPKRSHKPTRYGTGRVLRKRSIRVGVVGAGDAIYSNGLKDKATWHCQPRQGESCTAPLRKVAYPDAAERVPRAHGNDTFRLDAKVPTSIPIKKHAYPHLLLVHPARPPRVCWPMMHKLIEIQLAVPSNPPCRPAALKNIKIKNMPGNCQLQCANEHLTLRHSALCKHPTNDVDMHQFSIPVRATRVHATITTPRADSKPTVGGKICMPTRRDVRKP